MKTYTRITVISGWNISEKKFQLTL